MTEAGIGPWGKTYPASTPAPPPSHPGMVVHSVFDVSVYAGTPQYNRYIAAVTDHDQAEALKNMPLATVSFFEAPIGIEDPFNPFDD